MNKHIIIDNVKLTTSDNPTITINRSYVQLVKNIVPKYRTFSVNEVPLWSIYSRKHKRMTDRPVALADIPQLIVEWNAQYGPDTYNAYPRGSLRLNRRYYCRVAYGQLEVYTANDDVLQYVYSLDDARVLYLDDKSHRSRVRACDLRRQYFQREHGEMHLNLYQVDRCSRQNVLRRMSHDGR